MQVGCLGRRPRPPRWTSRRTRWRRLLRASEVSVVLVAVLIAGTAGAAHLPPFWSESDTTGPGIKVVVRPPAADVASPEGTSPRSMAVDDHPRPTIIDPSTVDLRSAEPKRKHPPARLRSTAATHRQLLVARATPSNGSLHCNLHSPARDPGCQQEGARRLSGVALPPS